MKVLAPMALLVVFGVSAVAGGVSARQLAPARAGATPASLDVGKKLFMQRCSLCHLPPLGPGEQTSYARSLAGFVTGPDTEAAARLIVERRCSAAHARVSLWVRARRDRQHRRLREHLEVSEGDRMSTRRFIACSVLLVVVAAAGLSLKAYVRPLLQSSNRAAVSDGSLFGTVTGANGQPLEGVVVSARAEGQRITTSVFTDDSGRYYFPPLERARYGVWAQAVAFETGRANLDSSPDDGEGPALRWRFRTQHPRGLFEAAVGT